MSDDDLRWRLGARHPGHDYRIFRTLVVDADHPQGGRPTRFSLIECGDWVNIIALTPEDQVVMLRQYRPGTENVGLEIPGGMVDPGEDPRTAAERELLEETGYTATDWRKLGTVSPNPAIQTNFLHTYLALDARRTREPALEEGEVLSVFELPLAEVRALLQRGEVEHALVVTAFGHLAFQLAELRRP